MFVAKAPATERHFGLPDALILATLIIFIYYLTGVAQHWAGSFHAAVPIDLSLASLPKYAFFSLIRATLSYGVSLVFALVFGYAAAKIPAAERVLLPLLDIGQSVPVMGFMPGLVLGLVALFPDSNIGLELACVLLIFTSQVWGMVFSFHASLKALPNDLSEMGRVVGLGRFRRLLRLELPFAATPLAWNSLMAMAGGWFFLTACESFTLGERRYALPGLGSYMSLAIQRDDRTAMLAGIAAMFALIIFVDFMIWRPLIAWTRKFRMEEDVQEGGSELPFMALLYRESYLLEKLDSWLMRLRSGAPEAISVLPQPLDHDAPAPVRIERAPQPRKRVRTWLKRHAGGLIAASSALILLFAFTRLWELIRPLGSSDWLLIARGTALTSLRVFLAVLLSSLWTIPFGIWMGLSPRWTRLLQPVIQLAASFPAPMIYPLALAFFQMLGLGMGVSSVFLMFMGVQWYVLFNVLAGASTISPELRMNLDLLGVRGWRRWTALYLPSVFPSLVTGWLTAAGGAWNASVIAEYFEANTGVMQAEGLGSLISSATAQGNYALLGGCLLVMVGVVVGLNRTLWSGLQNFAEQRFRYDR